MEFAQAGPRQDILQQIFERFARQLDDAVYLRIIAEDDRRQLALDEQIDLAVREHGCHFLYQWRDEQQVAQPRVRPGDQDAPHIHANGLAPFGGRMRPADMACQCAHHLPSHFIDLPRDFHGCRFGEVGNPVTAGH